MNKLLVALGVPALLLVGMAGAASAQTTAADVVEGGAETLSTNMLAIGAAVLPLAAGVIAILIGWRYARRFFGG